ncbi:hypothetical protein [Xenorhabdus sp. KK7.4]|uniref:hypothetical protein n=1 Tax=Xenorhabdus sp. KK7.4 TaxID=1851572 RepID=UPI000C046543|nr:hypothetical protein [Xenorhabdus sp. KK7.4]PHM59233.1 hypothetical protein Xekk_00532 [Xenorhabdus sp. KK7.4]
MSIGKKEIDGVYSIKPNSDLIIGQNIIFSVKVTMPGNEAFPPGGEIRIKKDLVNINILSSHAPSTDNYYHFPIIENESNKEAGEVDILMSVKSGLNYGDPITFEVSSNISTFKVQPFNCIAKDLNSGTLNLNVVNQYLEAPYPTPTQYSQTKVNTNLRDQKSGTALKNTPVFITSIDSHSLEQFDIYDSNNQALLPPVTFSNMTGIMVSSSDNGDVVFYVHAKNAVTARVSLLSIAGPYEGFSKTIYSVYAGSSDNPVKLPVISGYNPPGYLNAEGNNSENFIVSINQYVHPSEGDAVLFFYAEAGKHKQFTGYIRTISSSEKPESGEYVFELPYQMFPYLIFVNFSYVIIRKSGDTLTSMNLPLTYAGGVPYEPKDDVKRPYQPCKVYPSYGVGKDDEIMEYTPISYADIRAFSGSDGSGLYIKILGTENPTLNKDMVPVGSSVTLTTYINTGSDSKVTSGVKSYPPVAVTKQGDEVYAVIHIPYEDLAEISNQNNGQPATIRIEYSIQDHSNDNNSLLYGKVWVSTIGTISS